MVVVSMVVFALVRLSGGPIQIMAPPEASQADIAAMRAYLGLVRPVAVQYGGFITRAVQGDFGQSVRFRRPALDMVLERYGATLELGGLAVVIVIAVALPVGVYAAVRRGRKLDYAARAFAALGQAVPPFWLGLLLVLVFGVILHWLPTSGRGTPLHIILPGITLGWFAVAGLMRLTRSAMLDVLGTEYVKLARIKGLPERQVIWKHAFKNAALPVVTFAGPRVDAPQRRGARRWRPAIPLAIVLALVGCALFAPLLAPRSPVEGSLGERLIPPLGMDGARPGHPLGTDRLGRDTLSRLVYGARISLSVSIVGIALTGALGSFIGLLAGFLGGWVDTLLMRLVDISLSLPGILIAVLLSVVFEPSFTNVIIVVVFLLWPSYARLVRGETLGLKQQEFVALARIAGCSSWTIMFRHIVPNLAPSILVLATLHVGFVIVLEAALSFLGVGITPPTPSWGVMVADGRGLIEQAWWVSILPGIAILVTVLSLNILGDWVRDRLDPKLRQM